MADDDVTTPGAAEDAVNPGAADDQSQSQDTVAGGQDTVAAGQGDDTVAGGEEKVIAPDWPDDWRDKLTADEKLRKRLDRFQSPKDVLKAYTELERKLSSGEVKAKLPADATEEQIAAWRKDNGIPEKPEGYLEKLPSGLVIGDEDKPLLEGYLARVHGKNASPEVVADTLDWYYDQQEKVIAAQAEADKEYRTKSEDALRAEWGGEYRANVNAVKAFIASAPADDAGTPLADLLMGARLADGTLFGSNPAALRWMARMASEANPAGFVAPGAGGSQSDSIAAEIEKIEGIMRTDRAAYDRDEKMRDRLRQLYAAEEKLKR